MSRLFLLLSLGCLNYCINFAQTTKPEFQTCNANACKIFDPLFRTGEKLVWEGECNDSFASGKGVLKRYKNDALMATYEGNCLKGIFEGPGTYTDQEGSLIKGNFVKGYIIGQGTKNWVNGFYYTGEFLNFKMHGNGKFTTPSGLVFEGYFSVDDLYSGKITEGNEKPKFLHKNNIVKSLPKSQNKYNPEIGVKLTEYFNGSWIRCEQKEAEYYRIVTYEAPNKPLGTVKDYYINGKLQSEFSVIYLDYEDDGKNFKDGLSTWYFKSGKISNKTNFKNGKQDGLDISYFENGNVFSEINYVDGVRNGLGINYYPNGKKQIQTVYVDGDAIDKKYIEYDENDQSSLVSDVNFYDYKDNILANSKDNMAYINNADEIVIELKKKDVGTYRSINCEINQKYDYSIEAKITKVKGRADAQFGLIFGYKDWNNFYEFLISETGSYTVRYHAKGETYKLIEFTSTYSINSGNQENSFKVKKSNNEFHFYMNDNLLKSVEGYGLTGFETGIIVYSPGTYKMSGLKVREFLPAELLSKWGSVTDNNPDGWMGNGSGFFINENGYLATNYHVIEDASAIQVEYFQQGKKYTFKAKVVATDKLNDLAVLQINDSTFSKLPSIPYIFNTDTKDVGSDVFALGYPIANVMGSEIKFTDGKISSKTGVDGNITTYQISVPIQSGNSGGPLFDSNGNLVGITSSRLNKEVFNSENVNYAIKASYLKNLIDVLPEKIALPNYTEISKLTLTEKIKLLSDFTPIIRIK